LLAISSGDLRAVYPCRFCQIFRTWNAWILHQQDCIELGLSLQALLSQLAMGTMHDCLNIVVWVFVNALLHLHWWCNGFWC
jgi:hypothetical protein